MAERPHSARWIWGVPRARVRRCARCVHRAGLLDRDLTRANVLVTDERRGRLGLRVEVGPVRSIPAGAVTAIGDLRNNLPTWLRGKRARRRAHRRGPTAYAFGVMLYESLCGELPFDGHARYPTRERSRAIQSGLSALAAVRSRPPWQTGVRALLLRDCEQTTNGDAIMRDVRAAAHELHAEPDSDRSSSRSELKPSRTALFGSFAELAELASLERAEQGEGRYVAKRAR